MTLMAISLQHPVFSVPRLVCAVIRTLLISAYFKTYYKIPEKFLISSFHYIYQP